MSPDTLAPAPTLSGIPGPADVLSTVPQRRYGQWAAVVADRCASDSVLSGTGTAR
ncbi:hypothetical protein ABZ642_30705 [Streptomyces sp. NPDC007157]|uniref:hypothetical protein n=1 Tax=Streptomyces sp. NPDC007157 TaxID=3154681 RepID=UPI0033ED15AA